MAVDSKKLFRRRIDGVSIQTSELVNQGNWNYDNIGFVEKGSLLIEINPRETTLIDGNTINTGFDCRFEVKGLQLYDMFNLTGKYNNKKCWLLLIGTDIQITDIIINVKTSFKDDKQDITIYGTKFVGELTEFIIGMDPNLWGSTIDSNPYDQNQPPKGSTSGDSSVGLI